MTEDDIAGGLLDRELTAGELREAAVRIAAPLQTEAVRSESALLFRVGTEWFALPTAIFDEVAEASHRHTVPHRRGMVLGIVNIRGELLPCISLRVLLGVTAAPAASPTERVIVIRRGGLRIACLSDEVSAVLQYDPARVMPVPATVDSGAYVRGLLPWNERKAGLLDDELLFYSMAKGLT